MLPLESSLAASPSLWIAAVEVFDGSTIVDPIVVSNVFWNSLQTKLVSFVLGQLLATAAFCVILSLAASQFTRATEFVATKIFSETTKPVKIPKDLRDNSLDRSSAFVTSTSIEPDIGKLFICLAIDAIGTSSVLIPFLGDATDVVTAPLAGLLLQSLFGGSNILFVLEFSEEILPFTDILPLATLCWCIDTFFRNSDLARLLQLGEYRTTPSTPDPRSIDIQKNNRSVVIDVDSKSNNV